MVISKLPDTQVQGGPIHYLDDGGREEFDRNRIRTESGWDNPFRPGGDLSREADEIVNLIKGGKPITPTGDPANGSLVINGNGLALENGATVVDGGGATKAEASQLNASAQNGAAKSPQKSAANGESNGTSAAIAASSPQTQVVPGPQSASHVIIEDKKKKKCTCCVIQ